MGTKRIILGEGWSIMTMGVPDRNDTVDDQDLRYLEEQGAHQSEYSTSSVSLHLGQQADRGQSTQVLGFSNLVLVDGERVVQP